MEANLEVNPADIRFTQDSISLYFQRPHDEFSVREAVRKLSKNEMRPDNFPPIRVNSYRGCLWSIDNRRLWVFRFARYHRIKVELVREIHPRLNFVLSNGNLYSKMQKDFFPRVRDKGKKDFTFDLQFPRPVPSLPLYSMKQAENFFSPRFRDREKEDLKLDQQIPQPVSSLQLPVHEAPEKPPINVASTTFGSMIGNAVGSLFQKIFSVAWRAATGAVASDAGGSETP